MRQITHLHGMTESAFNAWRKQTPKNESGVISPWTCSDGDGFTYLWDIQKLINSGETEEEYSIDHAESRAYESALIQCAVNEEEKVYILFLDLSNCESIENDDSCENMPDASRIPEDELTIDKIVYIREYKVNKWFSPWIIAGLLQNPQFNQWQISEELLQIAQICANSNTYPEDIYSLPEAFQFEGNEI